MNIEDQIVTMIPVWRRMVEDAGGQWVGVQQSFTPFTDVDPLEPYCLFIAPHSQSPISLPISQMTPESVKEKLGIPKINKEKNLYTELVNILERFWELRAALHVLINDLEEIKNKCPKQ